MSTTATMNAATAIVPRSRPIPLKPWEVRAVLDGRKTQLRRVINLGRLGFIPSWIGWIDHPDDGPGWYAQDVDSGRLDYPECWGEVRLTCPFGCVGGRLWGQETWAYRHGYKDHTGSDPDAIWYRADGQVRFVGSDGASIVGDPWDAGTHESELEISTFSRWRSPLHLPRWASRLTLEIESVRVQRLQEISEGDVQAEGCTGSPFGPKADAMLFPTLWESIHGPGSWEANPWLWCISFRRIESEGRQP